MDQDDHGFFPSSDPVPCFLNLNWEQPFNSGDSRELIGSICNSGAASCYATPLNSPPKLQLSVMDPHHLPAKLSCFGAPALSRVSSTQSLSRVSRKRKAPDPKGKGKDPPPPPSPTPMVGNEDNTNPKRCKRSSSSLLLKAQNENVDAQTKPEEEAPKDYIHVRARRGQATDSHSLAERVRREKISERMKFLQDLVPGCNKVIGKAVMLDEIINYVQSLQHQVEFLSMKLATVNTRLDLNLENEMNQMCRRPAPPHSVYPLEATSTALFSFSNAQQPQGIPLQSLGTNGLQSQYPMNHLDSGLRRTLSMHLDGFGDAASQSQLGAFWEDDLHSVVQMGFGHDHNLQAPWRVG